ncbi:hypothetical protein AAMO2058_001629300 [Amorphochlora amoebiformis]|mmetsp:Transcript_26764/g.42479  ORF Transcript_26764/g.42479 Transcript_26764/m.42479 type:complete len:289 (-) Transcript_26764:299-1165(-)
MMNAGAARRIFNVAAVAGGAKVAKGSANADSQHEFSQPDKHRVIFSPNDMENRSIALDRKKLAGIAMWEMKDAPKDVLTGMVLSLGEDLAKDPAVQLAVYKRFGLPMEPALKGAEGDDDELRESSEGMDMDRGSLEDELAHLRDELESQQTLNDQLIYHSDRLSEDKLKLKRQLKAREARLQKVEKERNALEEKLNKLGIESKEHGALVAPPPKPADPANRGRDREHEREEEEPREEPQPEWHFGDILTKALAVAAIVILMAVVRKKGPVTVLAAAAASAWAGYRQRF